MIPTDDLPLVPVGMFDSGIGGFTVFSELRKHAPSVPVLYFGDTYHVPYGARPLEQIRLFALNTIDFLVGKGAGVIAIACNVSSSVLTREDRDNAQVPVFGLVTGGAQHAVNVSRNGRIGVIATAATVSSGSYQREIKMRNPDSLVEAIPCPKFVPLIEAGERDTLKVMDACREYLAPILKAGCDTVVYGCTHYPFLDDALCEISDGRLTFVDPAAYLAIDVVNYLAGLSGAELSKYTGNVETRIYLSEQSEMFVEKGSEYLGIDIEALIEVENINREISEKWEENSG